jgi:hypothetical protein
MIKDYQVTQRCGGMYRETSELSTEDFIKAVMNLGSGLERLHVKEGQRWTLVYDLHNKESITKHGTPGFKTPSNPPIFPGEEGYRGETPPKSS